MAQTVFDVLHTAKNTHQAGVGLPQNRRSAGPSCNYAGIRCSLNKKVRMQTNFQKYRLSSNVQMYHIGPRLVQPAAQFLAYPF